MKDKHNNLKGSVNSILQVTLMPLLLLIIRLYQNHISSKKGYKCAHGHQHADLSCSAHALHALTTQNFFTAVSIIMHHRKACHSVAKQQGFTYKKLYSKSGLAIVALSMMTGCGGGGDDGGGSSNNNIPPDNTPDTPTDNTPPTPTSSVGMVELGAVEGANIQVQTLDGYTLDTAVTNSEGLFSIDIESLKQAVNRYGTEIKFVKVVSTGGIDTDPNDDGVIVDNEKEPVNGSVTGIVPIDTLYQAQQYRINFISTALVDILGDEENATDDQIAYIVKRLGIHDTNGDGTIDLKDITDYKMIDDESVAETELRDGYLEYIHDGDVDSQQLFIDDLKYDVGFTRPLITQRNGYYEVNLSKTDENNTIYYALVVNENKPSFNEYYGEQINVNSGDSIYYKECSESYGCYKLQKVFFYDNDYFMDNDYEPIEDNYEDTFRDQMKVQEAKTEYNQALKELEALEIKKSELESSLEDSSGTSGGL